jgi:hypothetical protein
MNIVFSKRIGGVMLMLLIFGLAACGSGVTRSSAAKLLEKGDYDQYTQTIKYSDGPFLRVSASDMTRTQNEYEGKYNKLKSGGWIDYKKTISKPTAFGYGLHYDIQLMEKIKPYVVKSDNESSDVVIGFQKFNEITGVIEVDSNNYRVEFNTKIERTPLADSFPAEAANMKPSNKLAIIKKYDDGWRVVEIN